MFHVIFRAVDSGCARPWAPTSSAGCAVPRSETVMVCAAGRRRISRKVVVAASQFNPNNKKSPIAASFNSSETSGMLAQAIERVAEKKKLSQLGIVKGLHAEMIARAKQQFLARVPDRECEIPAQMLHALLAPGGVGAQNQVGVSGGAARRAVSLLRES